MPKKKNPKTPKLTTTITIIATLAIITTHQLTQEKTPPSQPNEPIPQYTRKDYKHWIDADKDCQDTRQEVLIQESLTKPTLDKKGCKVLSGKWFDLYTGQTFTDPKNLDIDHFISLKEAHRSGAHKWSKQKKQDYANDLKNPETLIAVQNSANRSKSDKDPSDWLPSNQEFVCDYVRTWAKIKEKWGLVMDERERRVVDLVEFFLG